MEKGYLVEDDKGNKKWWDGKSLTPVKVDMDPKQPGYKEDMKTLAGPMSIPSQTPEQSSSTPGAQQPDILKEGGQMAWGDAKRGSGTLARNVLVPAAQAGLGIATGGMSVPAQVALGVGSEAIAQRTGLAPESNTQLGLSALGPILGRVLPTVTRAAGKLFTPSEKVSQIGKEAVAQRLGEVPDVVERAATRPASDELYAQARGAGSVATGGMKSTVDDALKKELSKSTPDRATVKRLENLTKKLTDNPNLDAAQVVDELQDLGHATTQAFKQKQSVRGTHLKEATGAAKQAAGKDIPALADADAAYSRERVVKDVLKATGQGNPVKALDELIEKSGPQMLKVMSKEELQDVRDIAGRIGRSVASEGMLNRLHEGGKVMLSDMVGTDAGRKLLRHVMGPKGDLTGAKLGAAFTFWRAYKAYEEDKK
jgi:hypothetical protein